MGHWRLWVTSKGCRVKTFVTKLDSRSHRFPTTVFLVILYSLDRNSVTTRLDYSIKYVYDKKVFLYNTSLSKTLGMVLISRERGRREERYDKFLLLFGLPYKDGSLIFRNKWKDVSRVRDCLFVIRLICVEK